LRRRKRGHSSYVEIGRSTRLRNVVIDRGVKVPDASSSARIRSATPCAFAAPKKAFASSPEYDRQLVMTDTPA